MLNLHRPCISLQAVGITNGLYHAQVWNVEDAEDEVLAMVVRTGLNTTMGAMVRQLIAPVSIRKEKQPFEPVSMCLAQC